MTEDMISDLGIVEDGLEPSEVLEVTTGIVVDCFKLNIRREATLSSDIVNVVPVNTKLVIDVENSTASWYAVLLDGGKRGFAMKQFVKIKD